MEEKISEKIIYKRIYFELKLSYILNIWVMNDIRTRLSNSNFLARY